MKLAPRFRFALARSLTVGLLPLATIAATAPSVREVEHNDNMVVSVELANSPTADLDAVNPVNPANPANPATVVPDKLLFDAEPQELDLWLTANEVADQTAVQTNTSVAAGQGPLATTSTTRTQPLDFDASRPIYPAGSTTTDAPRFTPIEPSPSTTFVTTVWPGTKTNAAQPSRTTPTNGTTTTSRAATVPSSRVARGSTTSKPPATTTTRRSAPTTTTTRPSTTTTTTAATTTTSRTTTTSTTTPQKPAGPTLVWQDNFDSLDSHVWRKEHSTYGDGNNELQCYRPENVSVSGGKLILQAKTETYTCPNGSVRHVTSGMVRSQGVLYKPGQRIEFRIKINPADRNDQRGLWPALWASSWNGGGWPRGGEFDWLEYVGTTPTKSNHAIHWQDTAGRHKHSSKAVDHGVNFSDAWHTIAFDWGQELVWYVDGRQVQRINPLLLNAANNPFLQSAQSVSQLKINFALGGNWPGPLGPTTIDAAGNTTFEVDYVRIYDLP